MLLFHYTANYLENWKCISVLKADGTSSLPPPMSTLYTPQPQAHVGMYPSTMAGSHAKDKSLNWFVVHEIIVY